MPRLQAEDTIAIYVTVAVVRPVAAKVLKSVLANKVPAFEQRGVLGLCLQRPNEKLWIKAKQLTYKVRVLLLKRNQQLQL